jgi:Mg2+ and Co2+ transporter CorA
MQNAPSATPEQVFPYGVVLAVILVAAVAIALIWWMKKTRGGRRAPSTPNDAPQ